MKTISNIKISGEMSMPPMKGSNRLIGANNGSVTRFRKSDATWTKRLEELITSIARNQEITVASTIAQIYKKQMLSMSFKKAIISGKDYIFIAVIFKPISTD